MKDEIMSKEKEKCPTCVNDLILEIRIVDMGLLKNLKKQYIFTENQLLGKILWVC